jgi:tetratricopeptide (TPR) repeat protein
VLSFASNFNDDTLIEEQLAEGKALYPYLKSKDYDGAVAKYMELAKELIHKGKHRDACCVFKKMLNILISDKPLIGSCNDMPLNDEHTAVALFNNAILCLYGSKPELAITYTNKLLAANNKYEVLYIKTRALTMLGNYKEADELNVTMSELIKPEPGNGDFDPKFLYSYAVVNEVIGDPYLEAYQSIVLQRPEYLAGHLLLFNAMKKQNKNLVLAEGHELPELAKCFNETLSENTFIEALKNTSKGDYTHRILWATDCPVGKFNQSKEQYSRNLEIFKQRVIERFNDEELLENLLSNNARKLYGF